MTRVPELDQLDRRLIRELQTDARQSNVELARKVGRTEGAVRRRINALLSSRAFRIVAVGDPDLLGLHTHAVIGLRTELDKIEEVATALAAMRELSYVYETTGQFDIIIVGFFASNDQMREFLTRKLAKLSGITDTDTFLVMRTVKRSFRWGEGVDEDAGAVDRTAPARRPRRMPARR